jgi:hypothetical protein
MAFPLLNPPFLPSPLHTMHILTLLAVDVLLLSVADFGVEIVFLWPLDFLALLFGGRISSSLISSSSSSCNLIYENHFFRAYSTVFLESYPNLTCV